MYHRFHAPYACKVRRLIYISGDTWNVNPIALQRITHLFCKNERAIIPCELSESGAVITLVLWRRFWLRASGSISPTSCCI